MANMKLCYYVGDMVETGEEIIYSHPTCVCSAVEALSAKFETDPEEEGVACVWVKFLCE